MGVARPLAGETVGKKPMFWVRNVMVLKARQHARAHFQSATERSEKNRSELGR